VRGGTIVGEGWGANGWGWRLDVMRHVNAIDYYCIALQSSRCEIEKGGGVTRSRRTTKIDASGGSALGPDHPGRTWNFTARAVP
jgi:hypothetical protein